MAPPSNDAEITLKQILESEKRNLYCFDWDKLKDELGVWGRADHTAYRYIEVIMTPCNTSGWDGSTI